MIFFPCLRINRYIREGKQPRLETHLSRQNKQVAWAMETIPVVDDEGDQREIACAMLTKSAYNVKAVSNGEEAVEYVE